MVFAAAVLAVFAVATTTLALGIYIETQFRPQDSAFGLPSQIPTCGRRFFHAPDDTRVWTRAEVEANMDPGRAPLILEPTIGEIPLIDSLLPDAGGPNGTPCTVALWLHIGDDRYVAYALEGGP